MNDLTVWGSWNGRCAGSSETHRSFIVHDIKFVNKEIRIGQYFFGDIANEGVLLRQPTVHAGEAEGAECPGTARAGRTEF